MASGWSGDAADLRASTARQGRVYHAALRHGSDSVLECVHPHRNRDQSTPWPSARLTHWSALHCAEKMLRELALGQRPVGHDNVESY